MGNQRALGHKQTEEHKHKRSEAMKRWWAKKKAGEENEQRATMMASSDGARTWQPL